MQLRFAGNSRQNDVTRFLHLQIRKAYTGWPKVAQQICNTVKKIVYFFK